MNYQPVNVEIRVEVGGKITPLRVRWESDWFPVMSIGRSWSDESGDHWLVMIGPPQRVVDLLWTIDATWEAAAPGRPSVA